MRGWSKMDHCTVLIASAVLMIIVAVAVISLVMRLSKTTNGNKLRASGTPAHRIAAYARERGDYRIMVGLPRERPIRWAEVSRISENAVEVDDRAYPFEQIRGFLVAYPNGQLVDAQTVGLSLPEWTSALQPSGEVDHSVLQERDLELGARYVRVTYGPSPARPGSRDHYSTTATNVSDQRIRITRFAGYVRGRRGWELNTVTGKFFSAEEFREWYGLQGDWIAPGESATDPNNYGAPPVLWAYFCEAEDGTEFIAGAVLQ